MQDLKAIRFIQGTKISHDYQGNDVSTFSYRDLCNRKTPAIGIPARQNGLIIVDVDVEGAVHKHDGREWWWNFVKQYAIQPTYTVRSPSGGYHFYFKLPEYINLDTFSPPSQLALGVDLKYNGWVGAPPTHGYTIDWGDITKIAEAPQPLLDAIADKVKDKPTKEFDVTDPTATLELHRPLSSLQIAELRNKLEWMQTNASLGYAEWRDGLFALKAGIDDPIVLDELVDMWTYNKSYQSGDEIKAHEIVERAEKYGGVGPGTIFTIIKNTMVREGAPTVSTPWSVQEIYDRSKIMLEFDKQGRVKIEPSEANAASLIGAMFDAEDLYHDTRMDLYVFKGNPISDTDLTNILVPMIQSAHEGLGLEKFRKSAISGGLDVIMSKRRLDPHVRYLKSLEWDGVPRIDSFFSDYVGADDSEYIRTVSKNFWISLAARGLKPGIKFDTMVVIEGHEGIRKSTLIEAVGGEYTYAPASPKPFEELDDLRSMHQAVIVELPELIGLVGQSEVKIKAFLSKSHDHIRALWAKKSMKNERGFIMVGTTNDYRYLTKSMGARRFWPVRIPSSVKSINIERIKIDRDQLYAEAVDRFRGNERFDFVPSDMLHEVVSRRVTIDPLAEALSEVAPRMGEMGFSTTDVYRNLEVGGYISRGYNQYISQRIHSCMEDMGYSLDGGMKWIKKIESPLAAFF